MNENFQIKKIQRKLLEYFPKCFFFFFCFFRTIYSEFLHKRFDFHYELQSVSIPFKK